MEGSDPISPLLVITRHPLTKERARAEAERIASSLTALASRLPEGTVLERRGDRFAVRVRPQA